MLLARATGGESCAIASGQGDWLHALLWFGFLESSHLLLCTMSPLKPHNTRRVCVPFPHGVEHCNKKKGIEKYHRTKRNGEMNISLQGIFTNENVSYKLKMLKIR